MTDWCHGCAVRQFRENLLALSMGRQSGSADAVKHERSGRNLDARREVHRFRKNRQHQQCRDLSPGFENQESLLNSGNRWAILTQSIAGRTLYLRPYIRPDETDAVRYKRKSLVQSGGGGADWLQRVVARRKICLHAGKSRRRRGAGSRENKRSRAGTPSELQGFSSALRRFRILDRIDPG